MKRAGLILICLCICAGEILAQLATNRMMKMVTRDTTPDVPKGSFAAQPKTLYRIGTAYARCEQQPDVETGTHGLSIVAEPKVWRINLMDNTGRLIIDPGPTYAFHASIIPPDEQSQTPPLADFQFGREYEFLAKHKADPSEMTYQGKVYDVLTGEIDEFNIRLISYHGKQKPIRVTVKKAGRILCQYNYDEYEADLPPDMNLFTPPSDVEISDDGARDFHSEEAIGQAQGFTIELGDPEIVPDARGGVPVYPWFPDGHITVLPDGEDLQMYWAGASSYRTVGRSMDSMVLKPSQPVLPRGNKGDFDNGGAWLMSVFRISDSQLLGFFHAEDHEWDEGTNPGGIAWKSIAICRSENNGRTWEKGKQIITSPLTKPSAAAWGGSGDCCVVYDEENSRWVCYYQEQLLYMAISEDPEARPGSWRKYYMGQFTEPGLGGKASPIPGLGSGGNPSVHFNTYLNQWIMVWHTWRGSLVYSSSRNMTDWDPATTLISNDPEEKLWYPTIVGDTDTVAGQNAFLYYAYWPDKNDEKRQFLKRSVRFLKEE